MTATMTAFPSIDLTGTGRRIESMRKKLGYSVKDLQEYFGFEYPQAVYKWQHGECLPSVDNLFALARLFRVGMDDLLVACGSDEEVPLFSLISVGFRSRSGIEADSCSQKPPSLFSARIPGAQSKRGSFRCYIRILRESVSACFQYDAALRLFRIC